MRFFSLLLFLTVFSNISKAQQRKSIEATRIESPPKVDGLLNDTVWSTLPKYGDFNMFEPGIEGSIPEGYETQVQLAYDNKAIYIAAYMFDPDPNTILSQFSQRDNFNVQADLFILGINTLDDGINETRFVVTAAGTIGDTIVTLNGEDVSYNVVFTCNITKDEKGWYAEFRIPYNALRFPEVEKQNWSINFYRNIRSINETHSFAPIDITKGRGTQYNAKVIGIRDIKPPVRLTMFPFAQGSVFNFDGETTSNLTAGMDIKYGLSDSFTLDATLIPDFGQAGFDAVELNLGPFEQTFAEQRQFFVEGIDLFNRGGVFFTRRVGSAPTGSVGDLSENETIIDNPDSVNLLNAVKISGRTKEKLGVGFFNAITENTFASIQDTLTGAVREVLVEPLSNYNIVVLDQQFNDNSSISLINTNVTREGSFRDANTTGFVFDLANKENSFATSGRTIVSNVLGSTGATTGLRTEFDFARTKGNFRYRVGHDFANTTFDINDLGLNFRNNFNNFVGAISYENFEPVSFLNKYRFTFTARHQRLYDPNVVTGNSYRLEGFFAARTRFALGYNVQYNSEEDDYFEPRVDGLFVTFPESIGGRVWVSSDYRKKFAYDIGVGHRRTDENFNQTQYFFDVSPRYRFSDNFIIITSTDLTLRNNLFGYFDNTETDSFLGQRDIIALENNISASYNFDPYKAINLNFRNFWTTVNYSDNRFFNLNDDGTLRPIDFDLETLDPNTNFNIWNLDLSFRWRFAPGSEASLLYRNQIFNSDTQSTLNYTQSLENLFNEAQQHTVSLRITYFIDYNNIKYLFNNKNV